VAALGPGVAMAAGAVIVADVGLHPIDAGWTTAGAFVRDAARVLTRFGGPVRTVAIVVDTDHPERIGDLGLQLQGAARAGDPHLVMNGTQAVVVYDVLPDPDAETVAVAVAPGGGWRIAGVLGSDVAAEDLAGVVLRSGVVGATGRLAATAGPGCSPVWRPAPVKPARRARRPDRGR
ncbi:MAG TPA: hypothetical protein VN088_02910, partial [Nocardioides sp.]|nr:hypothetical protein [Nocardioides sp.]